jgi:hypothetical protein
MDNIIVGRYDTARDVKGHDYAGWIEPASKEWIMFVKEDHSVEVFLEREPSGAIIR